MKLEEYVDLNSDKLNMYKKYMDLVLDWNNKINLTAIKDEDEFILKHFIDSLTVKDLIDDNSKVIDVGTGAGFPGIPLKIYNDSLDITLLDSLNKRVKFLDLVIEELSLNSIDTIHGRAEDIAHLNNYREKYDVAISRAVAQLNVLVEYLLPFVKVGGKCICMKGPNASEEIENSKKAIEKLGGKIEVVNKIVLPDSNFERNIVVIKKIKNTNLKFPRKAGMPSKEPL